VRGVRQTHGAITIVNALFTGIGCALGVGLPVEAIVDAYVDGGTAGKLLIDPSSDSPLVREALREGAARYGIPDNARIQFQLRSAIPSSRGLKSSSAVSTATLGAAAAAAGREPVAEELAALSAEVCQRVGVSATGAFDDAMACLGSGFVVTDNPARRDRKSVV
jgi:shikimate kinase